MNKTWKNPSSTLCQPCINQYRARDPGVQSQDLPHQADRILAAASTYFSRHPPATATFPSGDRLGSSSSPILQNQPVTFSDPVEQLGSSSVNNLSSKNMVAPTSQSNETSSYAYNIDPNPNDDFEPVFPSQVNNNNTAAATAISADGTVTTDNIDICRNNNSSNSDLGPNNLYKI
ncbi:hypothetical protein QYF36_014022 [Acer negundo]|nr:hypothetical protein QYF36_014022 [Acer negundo]